MQDLPNGGGGGGARRCKHWPPGAGDPRYATDQSVLQNAPLYGVSCYVETGEGNIPHIGISTDYSTFLGVTFDIMFNTINLTSL